MLGGGAIEGKPYLATHTTHRCDLFACLVGCLLKWHAAWVLLLVVMMSSSYVCSCGEAKLCYACESLCQVREDKNHPGFAFGAVSVLDGDGTDMASETGREEEEGKDAALLSVRALLQLSRDHPNSVTAS